MHSRVHRYSLKLPRLLFVHYAVWWKCVLLESLDYLKMGLARHLIFCHDLAFSCCLC